MKYHSYYLLTLFLVSSLYTSIAQSPTFASPNADYEFDFDGSSICFDYYFAWGKSFDIQIVDDRSGVVTEATEFIINRDNGNCYDVSHLPQAVSYSIIVTDDRACESRFKTNCLFNINAEFDGVDSEIIINMRSGSSPYFIELDLGSSTMHFEVATLSFTFDELKNLSSVLDTDEIDILVIDANNCVASRTLKIPCHFNDDDLVSISTVGVQCYDFSSCGLESYCEEDGQINIIPNHVVRSDIYMMPLTSSFTPEEDILFSPINFRTYKLGPSLYEIAGLSKGSYAIGIQACGRRSVSIVVVGSCNIIEFANINVENKAVCMPVSSKSEKPKYYPYLESTPSKPIACDAEVVAKIAGSDKDRPFSYFTVDASSPIYGKKKIEGLCPGQVVCYHFPGEEDICTPNASSKQCVTIEANNVDACLTTNPISSVSYFSRDNICSGFKLDLGFSHEVETNLSNVKSILILEENLEIRPDLIREGQTVNWFESIIYDDYLRPGQYTLQVEDYCGNLWSYSFNVMPANLFNFYIRNCNCGGGDIFETVSDFIFGSCGVFGGSKVEVYSDWQGKAELTVIGPGINETIIYDNGKFTGKHSWSNSLEGTWTLIVNIPQCDYTYETTRHFGGNSDYSTRSEDYFFDPLENKYVSFAQFHCGSIKCFDALRYHSGVSIPPSFDYPFGSRVCGANVNRFLYRLVPLFPDNPCAGGVIWIDPETSITVTGGTPVPQYSELLNIIRQSPCSNENGSIPCLFNYDNPYNLSGADPILQSILAYPCSIEEAVPDISTECINTEARVVVDDCLKDVYCIDNPNDTYLIGLEYNSESPVQRFCKEMDLYGDCSSVEIFCTLSGEVIPKGLLPDFELDQLYCDNPIYSGAVYCFELRNEFSNGFVNNPIATTVYLNPEQCFNDLLIDEEFYENTTVDIKSSRSIISVSSINSNSNITMDAKNKVKLTYPFKTESGAHFKAMTEGCERQGNATSFGTDNVNELMLRSKKGN